MNHLSEFARDYPAESSWLADNASGNEFAASLADQIARRGSLSERQLEAIRRNLVRRADAAERAANASDIDVGKIESCKF